MNKAISFIFLFSFSYLSSIAQTIPIKEWAGTNQNKPLIFYLSGDGGLNKFSNQLCESLNAIGYDVTGFNSKSYFWSKKTPEQTTSDITDYLNKKLSGRKNQQIVFIGYSYGADVLPFILNRLQKNIQPKIAVTFLIASSGSTDFEIHIADFFESKTKRGMDVVTEINRLSNQKLIILNGSDDGSLDLRTITKKYISESIPGDHHFDGNIKSVVTMIEKYL